MNERFQFVQATRLVELKSRWKQAARNLAPFHLVVDFGLITINTPRYIHIPGTLNASINHAVHQADFSSFFFGPGRLVRRVRASFPRLAL